jgi:hypothetical protein
MPACDGSSDAGRSCTPIVPARPYLPQPMVALALLSLAIYVAAMTLPYKVANNDIWIHLKTGQYVLSSGWVPIKDPYSLIAANHDYVAHEWLAGVLFYLVYLAAGVTGLVVFKSALLSLASTLLYSTARLLGARLSVILPSFACLLYIATARIVERPHIFSYLMLTLYLWLFFRYREGGRNRRWLYAIPPAQAVWVNLHGGYIQGLALVDGFALGEACIWARGRYLRPREEKALPLTDVKPLAALVPACVAASLMNP